MEMPQQTVSQDTSGRPRHLVVPFKSDVIKSSIYNKKKSLKGTGVIIKEDLNQLRLNLVKEAAERYGFRNVWTRTVIFLPRLKQKWKRYCIMSNFFPTDCIDKCLLCTDSVYLTYCG
ncbi:unnamed protein product [Acanthoscelides obtectus]|uniref:Uncharacterized protein n=1 Tax=Acanthoscelides obtectus TaxID=200917 RepID=A0A9P0MGR1_ACAOB|nr:unnamed protein product [Acanthoscelides obtectus]CAK1627203.1 hypothetical protein AOBTE_LOCUS4386 [Acanthoscelides obtectus]